MVSSNFLPSGSHKGGEGQVENSASRQIGPGDTREGRTPLVVLDARTKVKLKSALCTVFERFFGQDCPFGQAPEVWLCKTIEQITCQRGQQQDDNKIHPPGQR